MKEKTLNEDDIKFLALLFCEPNSSKEEKLQSELRDSISSIVKIPRSILFAE